MNTYYVLCLRNRHIVVAKICHTKSTKTIPNINSLEMCSEILKLFNSLDVCTFYRYRDGSRKLSSAKEKHCRAEIKIIIKVNQKFNIYFYFSC